MNLSVGEKLHGFTLIMQDDLPEIDGTAYHFTHEASGARLLVLSNADRNKAFSISFKTPPQNDTGVFHILEHSVLCGSDRFPVKEPFVNLLKTSMQTFLNAMTFPDKTVYPVASTSSADLMNLMDVYLDAVLHPAIYHKPETFSQEGWHYELDPQDHVMVNGVVFNEMKGALSDPDSVLHDALTAALFPDTAYRFESGGTPEAIPTLTYEEFLDNHRRHYQLPNSYLMLYGDMDVPAYLEFLDERYLAPWAAANTPAAPANPLDLQSPVRAFGGKRTMVTPPENAALSLGYVIGTSRDRLRLAAMDILLDALTGSNESPLKRALLDADIADDIDFYIADGMLQPFVVAQAKGLHPQGAERFQPIWETEVARLADGDLDLDLVRAAIDHSEFTLREKNFGVADGVNYAITSMASWLYDDDDPLSYVRYEDLFTQLKAALDTDYYPQLLRSVFLENDHAGSMELVPVEKRPDGLDDLLARLNSDTTPEQQEAIRRDADELHRLQALPDTPEQLATLPHLALSDIGKFPPSAGCDLETSGDLTVLRHRIPTYGIVYAYRYYDLRALTWDDMPYAKIVAMMLGKLGTTAHTAAEIDTAILSQLGNFSVGAEIHEDLLDPTAFNPRLTISSSALREKTAELVALTDEIVNETRFDDADRILDVLKQKRIDMEMDYANAGHRAAIGRASSYHQLSGVLREQLGGVDFYRFLKDLLAHWDERAQQTCERLADVARRLLTDGNCLLSLGGAEDDQKMFLERHTSVGSAGPRRLEVPQPVVRREAFVVPTDVTFAAVGYDMRLLDIEPSGTWALTSNILSLDYLWNEVRVKGGAYGVGFRNTIAGSSRFYSYRDPHLDETVERFEQAAAWLSDFEPDPDEFEGYQVSTLSQLNPPEKPQETIRREASWQLSGMRQEKRDALCQQIIGATPSDVTALSSDLRRITDQKCLCVFGNRDIIESNHLDLTIIDLLNE